jgi:hypothetical protein
MGGNESQFEPTARRGKYYSITRKPQGGRVKLQWLFEIDGCPDICLAGQFVFKFIEERYDIFSI